MGKIFDPIGLLTPVTLLCNILSQITWEQEIGWDDDVGATITDQFKAWMIRLQHLSELRIPPLWPTSLLKKYIFTHFAALLKNRTELLYMPDHWEHLRPSLPCYVPSPDWRPEKYLTYRDLKCAQWFKERRCTNSPDNGKPKWIYN